MDNRLGFHYFPDTYHYRESDLQTWLPELQKLEASWITLLAPLRRSIPEFFLNGLCAAQIQPLLHFQLGLDSPQGWEEMAMLFRSYARWGVRYVALFDRPNRSSAWAPPAWVQADLVERFLDLFLPLAEMALQEGLIPIFPPLEPGGDYWDLAFLRASFASMARRRRSRLLDQLVIGAYAWAGNRPLDWGAGGAERWPGARPYAALPGMQDQRGFRIFDWYRGIARQELGKSLPLVLLRAGCLLGDQADPNEPAVDEITHAQKNLELARLLENGNDSVGGEMQVSEEVLACSFWLLADEPDGVGARQAWYQVGGRTLPVVDALRRWVTEKRLDRRAGGRSSARMWAQTEVDRLEPPSSAVQNASFSLPSGHLQASRPISHYVLLPLYAWGAAEWSLDAVLPILQQDRPTVGFSLEEARLADYVTVLGGEGIFPEAKLDELRKSGCVVERLVEDGTGIAP